MSTINPRVRKRLIDQWLPSLRQKREEYENSPLVKCMIAVLLTPLIMALVLILRMVLVSHDFLSIEGLIAGSLLSISALCFVYLAQIQSCKDGLLQIEFYLHVGDQDRLYRAV